MAMKVLFILNISKKNAKQDNSGIALWQILIIVFFSGIMAYLILFIQLNKQTSVECRGENKSNDGWIKCIEENINNQTK